ncbi:MAG: hypothetical protein AAGD06_21915 [Acidobacteriota bacterium]
MRIIKMTSLVAGLAILCGCDTVDEHLVVVRGENSEVAVSDIEGFFADRGSSCFTFDSGRDSRARFAEGWDLTMCPDSISGVNVEVWYSQSTTVVRLKQISGGLGGEPKAFRELSAALEAWLQKHHEIDFRREPRKVAEITIQMLESEEIR